MVYYTLLAAKFLFHFHFQKMPFTIAEKEASLPDFPSKDVSWESETNDNRAFLPPRINLMVLGTALSTVLVLVRFASSESRLPPSTLRLLTFVHRTFYRTVVLPGGWQGDIIRTEAYFNFFDATPTFLALFVLNLLSPACLLRPETKEWW